MAIAITVILAILWKNSNESFLSFHQSQSLWILNEGSLRTALSYHHCCAQTFIILNLNNSK